MWVIVRVRVEVTVRGVKVTVGVRMRDRGIIRQFLLRRCRLRRTG